jgi:hypothetical protein
MFLGISYDKWHGILAVIAVLIFFLLIYFFIIPCFELSVFPGVLIAWLSAVAGTHYLQSATEIYQALDRDIEKKYGSYQNFQENSRKDYKWFWLGISVSWIIPIIVVDLFFL